MIVNDIVYNRFYLMHFLSNHMKIPARKHQLNVRKPHAFIETRKTE